VAWSILRRRLTGHGLTGAWPRGEFTVEAYADFIEVLVGTPNLDRFVLAGHSLGGAVAWAFEVMRPGRPRRACLQLILEQTSQRGSPYHVRRHPNLGTIGQCP
jgi:pimeloyl-ACP methyl ester carboxylesterase